jgi:hypothetical protein
VGFEIETDWDSCLIGASFFFNILCERRNSWVILREVRVDFLAGEHVAHVRVVVIAIQPLSLTSKLKVSVTLSLKTSSVTVSFG